MSSVVCMLAMLRSAAFYCLTFGRAHLSNSDPRLREEAVGVPLTAVSPDTTELASVCDSVW